jgi:malate dehydrogenase (oxaloacetate-decarboxylating)
MLRLTQRQLLAPLGKQNASLSFQRYTSSQGKHNDPLYTPLLGKQVMEEPELNRGSAFTRGEREKFQLKHLLPYEYHPLELQVERATRQLFSRSDPVLQYSFLRSMRSQNQVLFYALLQSNLKKLLPIVYTPTVGEAIKRFSHLFRRAEGLFLSYPHFEEGGKEYLRDALQDYHRISKEDIDLIVVTDSQAILGIGDQGGKFSFLQSF